MAYTIKITPEMKRQFRSETTEHLNLFEKMLMAIEKDSGNQEAIHSAFRAIHSLKGNSDYLGIGDINALAHDLEDLMDDLRSSKILFHEDILSLLFEGLDLLRDMNRRITDDLYAESDISGIRERIRQIKTEAGEGSETGEQSSAAFLPRTLEQEIKVDLKKIDEFMTHISEFVIAKNRLNYLTENIIHNKDQMAERTGDLRKISADISRIANRLQGDAMKLRLVRINALFERLPRIVRELSHKNGKKIELDLNGGETEIERNTIESLFDPLIHLIRNAGDHGIETPEERLAKGKPEKGIITVNASQEGNHAIIQVTDDGEGLDLDRIRAEALRREFFTREEIGAMAEAELINLIFMPGFSTRSQATTISGRGVGLDVVRNNIQAAGGTVKIWSGQEEGTLVSLRVPVSMALTDVLLTEASERRYAFPFSSIKKTLKVRRRNIRGPAGKEIILFNDSVLPIRDLGDILEVREKKRLRKDSDEEISVLVITYMERIQGIVVDKILKQETLMIKPLEKCLAGIREFAGTTLLGDGSVVLVIDPAGMF